MAETYTDNGVTYTRPDSGYQAPTTPTPTATVQVNPTTTVPSTALTDAPKTTFDIQSLLNQNQQNFNTYSQQQNTYQQKYLDALKPDQNITTLQQQLNELKNQSLNTNLSAQAGIQAASQKIIPMEFIVGQQQNIAQQANLKLQTLAAQQAPIVDQLQLAQQARQQTLQSLETLMNFGKENYTTATDHLNFVIGLQKYQNELDQIKKQEDEAAKKFAIEYGVTSPYYKVGQAVYKTGGGWVSEKEFFDQNPQFKGSWANVPSTFIQNIDGLTVAQREDLNYKKAALSQQGKNFGVIGQHVDPATGQMVNDYGYSNVDTTSTVGAGGPPMRTDRNNNPTAMTTDVAKALGLVEGVDYVVGDKFPGNSNLYTAKLIGDPVQTTIKALDAAASDPNKQAFYTQNGGQRWTYIGMSDQQWLGMSADQKRQVIASMYKQEGGNGSLFQNTQAPTTNPRVDQYAQDVMNGTITLSSVPDAIQAAVSQRMQELKSTKYTSEFEARVDYNNELTQLQKAIASGSLASSPSEIISNAVATYGKYISKQEIEATVYNMFGVKQPEQQTQTNQTSGTTDPWKTAKDIYNGISSFLWY